MDTRLWLYARALETLERATRTDDAWERTRLLLEAVALRDLAEEHAPFDRRHLN